MLPKTTRDTLTNLGLSANEATIYEILLEQPNANIAALQKNSRLPRTLIYYILKNLGDNGLIIEKIGENNRKIYNAEPPEILKEILYSRRKELHRDEDNLKNLLPDLQSAYRLSRFKPAVKFFEGEKGYSEAINDTLAAKEIIYTYADPATIDQNVSLVNARQRKERQTKNIQKRVLVPDTVENRTVIQNRDQSVTEYRFLPPELKPISVAMQIYDNKINYLTVRGNDLIAVIIEDKDIYQMHRNIFEYLWRIAKL